MTWIELNVRIIKNEVIPVLVNLSQYSNIYICPDTKLRIWGTDKDGRKDMTGKFISEDECQQCMNKIKSVLLHGQIDQDWDHDGLEGTGLEWLRRTDPNHPDIKDEEFEEVF